MSLKEDNNNETPGSLTNNLQSLDGNRVDFPAQCEILITVEGIKARPSRKDNNMPTTIFLATDSTDPTPIAFSNIGTALDYVRDSHADLNPEGAALMLVAPGGLIPATNKAVKAASGKLRFAAAGADAASVVAAAQSKLDGALQACVLVGVDPNAVAMVGNLRAALILAQESVTSAADAVTFIIAPVELHKRGYTN